MDGRSTLITQLLNQILRSKVSLKEETREAGVPLLSSPTTQRWSCIPVSFQEAIAHCPVQGPHLCEPRRTTPGKETSGRSPRWWPSSCCDLNPPACPVSPFGTTPGEGLPRPRRPRRCPECRRAARSLPGVSGARARRDPAPSLPMLPVPVPVRALDHAAPDAGPRAAGSRASPAPSPEAPNTRYSPPTRYMLAAAGRFPPPPPRLQPHKGSGRLPRAGLEKRSPERGAGLRRSLSQAAQPAPPQPQPSRLIPARAVAAASIASRPGRGPKRRSRSASSGNELGSRRTGRAAGYALRPRRVPPDVGL